jgi:hypothetical protein
VISLVISLGDRGQPAVGRGQAAPVVVDHLSRHTDGFAHLVAGVAFKVRTIVRTFFTPAL